MLFHVIISARAQKHKLEGPQLDNFIQEKMRSVIIGETTNYSGDQDFICNWTHEGKELCRKSYCFLFKIARSKFDQCAKVMKETGSKFITSISHEKWEDDHVHTFTFAKTEEIIQENVGGMAIVGKA